MPHYVEISSDVSLPKVHDGLNSRRAAAAGVSAPMQRACSFVRNVLSEHSISGAVDIQRGAPLPPSTIAESKARFNQSRRAGMGGGGGEQWQPTPEEISGMFSGVYGKPVHRYRFVVLAPDDLAALANAGVLAEFIFDVLDRCVAEGCRALEMALCGSGRKRDGPSAEELTSLLAEALLQWQLDHPTGTPLGLSLTHFASPVLLAERILHAALYFSQGRDERVRGEVDASSKGAKGDDLDVDTLYSKMLQEIPSISSRRFQSVKAAFPTFSGLVSAVDADDGYFEARLGPYAQVMADEAADGESTRVVGQGIVGTLKAALHAEYIPDADDAVLEQARLALKVPLRQCPQTQHDGTNCENVVSEVGKPSPPHERLQDDDDFSDLGLCANTTGHRH